MKMTQILIFSQFFYIFIKLLEKIKNLKHTYIYGFSNMQQHFTPKFNNIH